MIFLFKSSKRKKIMEDTISLFLGNILEYIEKSEDVLNIMRVSKTLYNTTEALCHKAPKLTTHIEWYLKDPKKLDKIRKNRRLKHVTNLKVKPFSMIKKKHLMKVSLNLVKLDMGGEFHLNPDIFIDKHLKKLEYLSIRNCFSELKSEYLSNMPNLKELDVSGIPVKNLSFPIFRGSEKIETFTFNFINFADVEGHSKIIPNPENVKNLSFIRCENMTGDILRSFVNVEALTLDGSEFSIDDDTVEIIKGLKKLKSLDVSDAILEFDYISVFMSKKERKELYREEFKHIKHLVV